jgi:hypothetical protein
LINDSILTQLRHFDEIAFIIQCFGAMKKDSAGAFGHCGQKPGGGDCEAIIVPSRVSDGCPTQRENIPRKTESVGGTETFRRVWESLR